MSKMTPKDTLLNFYKMLEHENWSGGVFVLISSILSTFLLFNSNYNLYVYFLLVIFILLLISYFFITGTYTSILTIAETMMEIETNTMNESQIMNELMKHENVLSGLMLANVISYRALRILFTFYILIYVIFVIKVLI